MCWLPVPAATARSDEFALTTMFHALPGRNWNQPWRARPRRQQRSRTALFDPRRASCRHEQAHGCVSRNWIHTHVRDASLNVTPSMSVHGCRASCGNSTAIKYPPPYDTLEQERSIARKSLTCNRDGARCVPEHFEYIHNKKVLRFTIIVGKPV